MRKLLFLVPLVIALLLLMTVGTSSVSAAPAVGSGVDVSWHGGYPPPPPPPPPPPQWNYNSGVHKCCTDKDSGHEYHNDYNHYYYNGGYCCAQQPYMHQGYTYPSSGNCFYGDKYFADQYYKKCHGGYSGSYYHEGYHHEGSQSCDDPHNKYKPCVAYN